MSDDALSDAALTALGVREPVRARRLIHSLAGQGVTDDLIEQVRPALLAAIGASPDPDRALTNFVRWFDAVTGRYTQLQYLLRHPAALDIFFSVCGVSQLFSDILIRNPEYFEILANPGVRGSSAADAKTSAVYYRELSGFVDVVQRTELKLEAMRRFKQRELLRIGTRDILGLAEMPVTAREFSNLADACVQKVLEIGQADLRSRYPDATEVPLAVIAMGKLGGQELNYSSDIDLMFVAGDVADDERRTMDSEHATGDGRRMTDKRSNNPTPNTEHRTPNTEHATPNTEHATLNTEHPTPNTEHRTPNAQAADLGGATTLAEFVVNSLSRNMQNGHLFRVDVRLRPEGRFGPLVRTLRSYGAYYESWAEPWEMQALIKARPVAGDPHLADGFQRLVRPYVYRRTVPLAFVEAIRENKRRIERRAELEGVARTNVKIGVGGIRDVEFCVQLLQLERAGRDQRLRTPNTLEALERLREAEAITARQADELADDYRFLRTVEHRLQILYERQTQQLPTDPNERRLLARRLGYVDMAAFDADYRRRTARVHSHFTPLFYGARAQSGPRDIWRELLGNVDTPCGGSSVRYALEAEGFADVERAYQVLTTAAIGGDYGAADPDTRERFLVVAGRLIRACACTGDPDAALQGLEALALAAPNPAAFYGSLAEGEELLERLCLLAAGSLPVVQSLARHLEWLDLLVSDEVVDATVKTAQQATMELRERLSLADVRSEASFWDVLALYIQRERLRIAARDLWSEIDARAVGHELTALADAVIGAVLHRARTYALAAALPTVSTEATRDELPRAAAGVAVIGLGKLGGGELGYGSDWDVLVVYEGRRMTDDGRPTANGQRRPTNDRRLGPKTEHRTPNTNRLAPEDSAAAPGAASIANAIAEYLLRAGQELRPRGAPVEIDARLRPEGRVGALAYTVDEYRGYYETAALTWERQSLTRARPIAGGSDAETTGRAFMRLAHEVAFGPGLSDSARDDIRAMKRRIENERLKPDERWTDVKLGHGGLSDIEFSVQLLQMQWGRDYPQVRVPGTVEALHALAAVGALPAAEAARLAQTHTFWAALRNRRVLRGATSSDVLPDDARSLRALAHGLGQSVDADTFRRACLSRMRETRMAVERILY